MTQLPDKRRCVVCGTSDAGLQAHHIAMRANNEAAVVLLCEQCHKGQNRRQYAAGLIGRSKNSRIDPMLDPLNGLLIGFWGIFDAFCSSRSDIDGAQDLEERNDRFLRVTLRLLSLLSDQPPGSIGARPISNDRRGSSRRVEKSPASTLDEWAEATTAQIFPAIVAVIASVLPADAVLLPGLTVLDALQLFSPANAARLGANLASLESNPRLEHVARYLNQDMVTAVAVFQRFNDALAAEALGELDTSALEQLHTSVRSFVP